MLISIQLLVTVQQFPKNVWHLRLLHFNTTPCYGSTVQDSRYRAREIPFQYNSLLRFNEITKDNYDAALIFQYNSLLRFNQSSHGPVNGSNLISIQLLVTVQPSCTQIPWLDNRISIQLLVTVQPVEEAWFQCCF